MARAANITPLLNFAAKRVLTAAAPAKPTQPSLVGVASDDLTR